MSDLRVPAKQDKVINSFDCDGVCDVEGPFIYPGPDDVIITGRSYEEKEETLRMFKEYGIDNSVFFNPLPFNEKTRESSGEHKANVLTRLKSTGYNIRLHAEDDPVQGKIIQDKCPWLTVVYITHNLTEMENVRRD